MISESLYNNYFHENNISKNHEMTERKIRLIEELRNENQKNEYKLSQAQQLIYNNNQTIRDGLTNYPSFDFETNEFEKNNKLFSMKLRFVCSVFILTFLVLMDITGKPLGNINTKMIKDSIAVDYETILIQKIQNIFEK